LAGFQVVFSGQEIFLKKVWKLENKDITLQPLKRQKFIDRLELPVATFLVVPRNREGWFQAKKSLEKKR